MFLTLMERGASIGAEVLAACLMPDHLHVIVGVDRVDLVKFVADLKSCTTRAW